MKNKTIFLTLIIITAITLAACTGNVKNIPASTGTSGITEKQPIELYPAYITEGSEKKWGYINSEGKFEIQPKYENANDFKSNGMAVVSENGLLGLIDKSGALIIEPKYIYLTDFSEGKLAAMDDLGKSYLLDEKGQLLFQTDGSIDKLRNGLAAFSRKVDGEKHLWGYINAEGRVVIEPKYESYGAFSKDKAIVQISDKHYGIIDKEGKLLYEINNDRATGLSGDTFIFSKADENNGYKYGYSTIDGKILFDAVYSDAQEFGEDGLAIVNVAQYSFEEGYGVMNKAGDFIIPPNYPSITSLGNGIYAVPKAKSQCPQTFFIPKALFDKSGKQLTDFKYYDLERLENDLISATDDKNTYLINERANEVKSFLKVEGIGSIKPNGKLYKVEVDNKLYYLSEEGKTVWTSDDTIRLEGGLEVRMKTFRPDRCMLIQYPEVVGLPDSQVQGRINAMLQDQFRGDSKGSVKDGEMFTETIDVGFTANINRDLLIISKNGYYYPIGAAHGQPIRDEYHIDIKNGSLYTLKDLFKENSSYKEKLTELIKDKIAKINRECVDQIYSEDIGDFEKEGRFVIKEDSLQIYFYPYAIASYAAGFPEFDISYNELKDLVNIEGELWKSFDKNYSDIPGKEENEINPSDKAKIEEAMKNYESLMIEAINKNDFKLVEPWLYPESSLYISQKELVSKLNKLQIKEKLKDYSIEYIEDYLGMVYRVYVTENIEIQYPGKDYTAKEFKWVYSLKYSNESKQYQLTYMFRN